MRIGICGYGNVGKAVEACALADKDFELEVIFSRRKNVNSIYGTKVESVKNMGNYINQLDAVMMCGGSQEDLLWQSPEALEMFSIVDTFDTHKAIPEHGAKLQRIGEKYGNVGIYSCGWDPGLFSIARVLFGNIVDREPITFWGEGVSQGHSEALRNVEGVVDGVQHTIPNYALMRELKKDPTKSFDKRKMHSRHCMIATDGKRPYAEIEEEILDMPNYFRGQDVKIDVMPVEDIEEIRKKMPHQGEVLSGDEMSSMQLSAKMKNNPHFTAQIMLAYAKAIPYLSAGAYSVLDIPPGLVGGLKENAKML